MDRHKSWLVACCGLVLALGMSGCRSGRPEVPREPQQPMMGAEPPVGFSQEAHPSMGTPFPNGAPGSMGNQGGVYGGAPTFSTAPPPTSGEMTNGGAAGANYEPSSPALGAPNLGTEQPGIGGGAAIPQ